MRIISLIVCSALLVSWIMLSNVQASTIDDITEIEELPFGEMPDDVMQVHGHVEGGTFGMFVQLVDSAERIIGETVIDRDHNFAFPSIETGKYDIQLLNAAHEPVALAYPVSATAERQRHPYLISVAADDEAADTVAQSQKTPATVTEDNQMRVQGLVHGAEADMLIQLVDRSDRIVAETIVFNDGTFRFGSVLAGEYQARLLNSKQQVVPLATNLLIMPAAQQHDYLLTVDPAGSVQELPQRRVATPNNTAVIEGSVRAADTNEPLAYDGYVYLYEAGETYNYDSTWIGADGKYQFSFVPAGNYKLKFEPYNSTGYATEFYDSKPDLASADLIAITDGTTTTIDATVEVGAAIIGQVTSEVDNTPLAYTDVYVYDAATGSYISSHSTDFNGEYQINGLAAGGYKLKFTAPWNQGNLLDEFYNSQYAIETADIVTVSLNTTTTIDAALAQGGVIAGQITDDQDGTPLPDTYLTLYDADTGWSITSVNADDTGHYQFGGLETGTYKLRISPAWNDDLHMTEYYDNQTSLTDANLISATMGMTTTANAALARAAVVAGQVTSSIDGSSIAYGYVSFFDAQTNQYISQIDLEFDGSYRKTNLAAGSYKLKFGPSWSDNTHVSEYYDNKLTVEEADPITLTLGTTTTVDAELGIGAALVGTITDSQSDQPLASTNVTLYDASGNSVDSSSTAQDGTYHFGGLQTGLYRLKIGSTNYWESSDHIAEFYNNQENLSDADSIALTVGTTTTIDASLERGAVAIGQVTDSQDGTPLSNVGVRIYDASGNQLKSDSTDSNGEYRLSGLGTGNYRICFSPSSSINYIFECHDNQSSLSNATSVQFTLNTTTTIDAELDRGATIAGLVTDAQSGNPLGDIYVIAYDDSGSQVDNFYTDSSGEYRIFGLPVGDYRICFDPYYNSDYAEECHDNKKNLAEADTVAVTLNTTTTVDAQLEIGGVIVGTLVDAVSNAPISNQEVDLYDSETHNYIKSSNTDSNGNYRLAGLQSGQYLLRFSSSYYSDNSVYLSEYYNNKQSLESADPISVTVGTTMTVNADLDRGAVIEGSVTDARDGSPLLYANVTVYDSATGSYARGVSTDSNGYYHVQGLPAGDYKLEFKPNYENHELAPEFYDDKHRLSEADSVSVSINTTTTVDADLQVGAVIIGRITDQNTSQPVSTTTVQAYDAISGVYIKSASVDDNGDYRLLGLPSGTVKLLFDNYNYYYGGNTYLTEYYNQKRYKADADPITITVETTTTIDYQVRRGGVITGVVTAGDTGEPLAGVYVNAYQTDPNCDAETLWGGSAYTDESGVYTISGLFPGSYRVYIDAGSSSSASMYHDDSQTDIAVQAGMTTQVDAALQRGGLVLGRVTAEDTGNGLGDVGVTFYRRYYSASNNQYYWSWDGSTETDANGYYTSTALSTNDYAVAFYTYSWTGSAAYVEEMYDNQMYNPYWSNATPTLVPVTLGATVSGIDASLARGVQVSGRVIAGDTGEPLADVWVDILQEMEDSSGWYGWGFGTTDANGYYTTTASPPGAARISFSSDEGGSGTEDFYIDEYYDNQAALNDATELELVVGQDATNIDATLARGGSISGNVTDADGNLLNTSVRVSLFDSNGRNIATDYAYSYYESGYQFNGLRPGTYYVLFNDTYIRDNQIAACGSVLHYGQYYDGASTFENATPIVVSGTETQSSIDGVISTEGSSPVWPGTQTTYTVSGRVTDGSNNGLEGVRVQADTGQVASTNANGEYTLNLIAGDYTLTPQKNGYSFAPTEENITVSANSSGHNFVGTIVPPQGMIEGTVTGDDGTRAIIPLENIKVSLFLWDVDSWEFANYTYSDENGDYRFNTLHSGEYRLHFVDMGQQYVEEYYPDAETFAAAHSLMLARDQQMSNMDAELTKYQPPKVEVGGGQSTVDPETGNVTVRAPRGGSEDITFTRAVTCESGSPSSVKLLVGTARFDMTLLSGNDYTVTLKVPDDLPTGSSYVVVVESTCPEGVETETTGTIELFDPSGYVTDGETGEPIQGAMVTLHYVAGALPDTDDETRDCRTIDTRPTVSGGQFGAWSGLSSAEVTHSLPAIINFDDGVAFDPTANPQVTAADGYYGWDVSEGCWYVVVEAEGYPTVATPIVGVPPEVTDLDIKMYKSYNVYVPIVIR